MSKWVFCNTQNLGLSNQRHRNLNGYTLHHWFRVGNPYSFYIRYITMSYFNIAHALWPMKDQGGFYSQLVLTSIYVCLFIWTSRPACTKDIVLIYSLANLIIINSICSNDHQVCRGFLHTFLQN